MKTYAGIGSRKTPPEILSMMSNIAVKLELEGYVLRSGGADGADSAFAKNVENKEIFVPWFGFNGINVKPTYTAEHAKIAESVHPAWHRCSQGVKKLHTRNVQQILGNLNNDKSKFVICWTPSGEEVGGTATAIRMAKANGIPVFNLAIEEDYDRINKWLNK